MKKYLKLAILLSASSTLGHATNMTLGLAQGFNVFTFSNFTPTGADTLGKVAVGGNFSGSGYLVGSALHDSATTLDFIVNGTLTDSNFTGTGGGIYVGGNATLSSASTGNLYVGGTLSTNNGALTTAGIAANGGVNAGTGGLSNSGNIYTQGTFTANYANSTVYAGTYNGPGYVSHAAYSSATNPLTVPTAPINFATAQTNLGTATTGLSTILNNTAANGTTQVTANNGLKLTGSDATQDVFDITAAQLTAALTAGTDGLVINAPSTAVVIINVTGTSAVTISGDSMTLNGPSANQVLFNFPQTTAISLNNFGFTGSVLAPGATFTGLGGQFNGTLIANSVTGVTEFHNDDLFTGSISVSNSSAPASTPEPSTWMMALTAIFFCAYAARKKFASRRD